MSNAAPSESSIWAAGVPKNALGDWVCSSCGSKNDGNRLVCKLLRCQARLPKYAAERINTFKFYKKGEGEGGSKSNPAAGQRGASGASKPGAEQRKGTARGKRGGHKANGKGKGQ